ncbi:MAG: hypothetical protein V4720_04035 [Pseudomonadota bacterium]|uniref:hypothetical protein n=1 Tax=Tabrizicola sp. TaxID=2005166 RepID=UPI0025D6CDC3|nr:hypothetical protein [Tabrizicola sp.]
MAPKPEDVAALQAMFDTELAQKRAQQTRRSDAAGAKSWLVIGLVLGLAAGAVRGLVLHPDTPFALETLSGDVLFALGLAILAAGPILGVVGAILYVVSSKWLSLAYAGAGMTVGTLLFGLVS